jgi:putative flippase GtrA
VTFDTLLTPARRTFLISALRYGVAGVANTLVGFGVIIGLELGLGVGAHLANAIGYAVGVLISFISSRFFVFRDRKAKARAPIRYGVAVAVAFAVNQGVLALARLALPDGKVFDVAAQGAAAVSYTGLLFVLSHFWVFADHSDAKSE